MATDQTLVDLAVEIAAEASELVVDRLGRHRRVETKANRLDLVTEVDRAAESLIVERILTARPDDGIFGEEGARVTGTTDIQWVIDPIDGTTSFVYGLPGFSISIAARRSATTVAGVVHAPAVDSVYVGGPDGASLNGATISCSACADLSSALIATGFSPDDERRRQQSRQLAALLPEVRDLRRMGSAALDLAAVAAGQLDAYFEAGLSEWDWAAGAFIVEQAGGVVISERDPTGRAFIAAAGPALAPTWFAKLSEIGADQT